LSVCAVVDPTFDLLTPVKSCHSPAVYNSTSVSAKSAVCQNNGQKTVYNADISRQRRSSTKAWNADVSLLMPSDEWLKIYGLKTAKLDMDSLLRWIGFRHADGKHSFTFYKLLFIQTAVDLLLQNLQLLILSNFTCVRDSVSGVYLCLIVCLCAEKLKVLHGFKQKA